MDSDRHDQDTQTQKDGVCPICGKAPSRAVDEGRRMADHYRMHHPVEYLKFIKLDIRQGSHSQQRRQSDQPQH